jgi:hypothetical protein
VASAYADVMIARARKAGCTEEVKHLQLAKEVIGRLKKDLMEIPWGTWLQGMLNDRLSEKIEAAGGKELLQWYDTHAVDTCPKLDYTPPNLSAYKPKTPPTR